MTSTLAPDTLEAPLPDPAPPTRPIWQRAGLPVLLVGTGILYIWGLGSSGWANAFYSAAAQAGSQSWTAWFFGSSDAANSITVDKTPGALWISGLSVRIFGLSSWSILVPQALMGVAAVALLYASVRRVAGPGAGLLAGATLALTPAAVLMFRFNNPDALLTLLLVGAAYATLRAVEKGGTRWLVLAAWLVGCGFMTKMLQAFLVLPALAVVWLLAAPTPLGKRLRDLALATVSLVVSAGWWVLVVSLVPAGSRPFIGGSQTDSVLELVFGYNGFGRLTGDEVGSVGGGAGGATGGWGITGLTRLFDAELGGQASWLIPAAVILLAALLWRARRAPRTDPLRAAALVWGGWLLVTGAVFSLMAGIFHPYYLVALAPPIAALVGIGGALLWRDRSHPAARVTLAVVVAVTAGWAFVLLRRTPNWQPWLAWTVLALGAVAALALLVANHAPRVLAAGIATVAVVAGLAGPGAYALATAATPHSGAIPSAGPVGAGSGGMFGARGGQPGAGQQRGGFGTGTGATPGTGRRGGFPGGTGPNAAPGQGGGFGRSGGGGLGGLLDSPTPGPDVVAKLTTGSAGFTWAAAAVGSNTAAGYQLASGLPVMAVGGFNGTDPSPTVADFQELVAEGRVHWFVGGGGPGGTESGGSDDALQIEEWVAGNFTPQVVGTTTLYDLTAPPAS
ncbi:ArnT family glycosyltransferase [Pseudonocardia sp. GCM10023141]|uniref:ArnT family glycosyltransferase n=1 Tax=Pseudonocardia sp. GCM10023141 TaxID=3252653 RepID=UPI0036066387